MDFCARSRRRIGKGYHSETRVFQYLQPFLRIPVRRKCFHASPEIFDIISCNIYFMDSSEHFKQAAPQSPVVFVEAR